jgi:hypothetical protein
MSKGPRFLRPKHVGTYTTNIKLCCELVMQSSVYIKPICLHILRGCTDRHQMGSYILYKIESTKVSCRTISRQHFVCTLFHYSSTLSFI